MYHTIITCPVCDEILEDIHHPNEQCEAMVIAMMAQPERRLHAEKSPQCTKHENWCHGWNKKTEKI